MTHPRPDKAAAPAYLRLRGLTKIYGPVTVVDQVDLDLGSGSIHALLGENGAGKSTIIKMIVGATTADAGTLEIAAPDGATNQGLPRSVAEAQTRGIVALPQELLLVPGQDAVDNIFLGMPNGARAGVLNRRELRREAQTVLSELGQQIPVNVPVGELSAVSQTMIAVARALVRDAQVLILDEPTAALTDTETQQLFEVLRKLRDQGRSILYVSHRLEEVFALCDTATVLRNGRLVWTKPIAETSADDVVTAMIGREQDEVFPPRASQPGTVVLSTDGLTDAVVRGVSLEVRTGRVLGIAGLAGAGRSELLGLLAGARKPTQGSIAVDGRTAPSLTVARAQRLGIGLVPEERRTQGLDLTETIEGNVAAGNLSQVSTRGVVSGSRIKALAERAVADLRVKTTSIRQPVAQLSGGNQQKVVLGKVLARGPRILLLDEPTRGIDVGTKAEIYALIRQLAGEGMAVVVVSSEIPELLGLADEIAVLHEGRLTGILDAASVTEETVLHHCYGKAAQ